MSLPCVMFSLPKISETDMKKAPIAKEELPQLEEPIQVEVLLLSEELLAQKLADDFCEFGSSETIGERHRE